MKRAAKSGGGIAVLLVAAAFATTPEASAQDAALQTPAAPPARGDGEEFRPDRHVAEIPLPLFLLGAPHGEARAALRGSDLTGVDAQDLAEALSSSLKPEVLERIRSLGRGYAAPEALAEAGLRVAYDPGTLTLEAEAEAAAFQDFDFFLSRRAEAPRSDLIAPARFAAGLDGSLHLAQNLNQGGDPLVGLSLDGFANFGGPDGLYLDFSGYADLSPEATGERFHRGRLTLFRDDRERAIRYAAGDVRLDAPSLAGSPDLLGVSLERRYAEIDSRRIVRALGSRSILLERPSTVEVFVNGAPVARFRAQPGRVNLNEIPFVDLGNEVTIYVEDEFGRRELDSFSFSSGEDLLAPGVSEFGLAGGAIQPSLGDGLKWRTETWAAQGYYRRGATPGLTLGAGAAVDDAGFASASLQATAALPHGIGRLEAAASTAPQGEGFAASAAYDAEFGGLIRERDQIGIRLDYRSADFASFGGGGGQERLSGSVSYHFGLSDRTNASLGAAYARNGGEDEIRLRAGLSHGFRSLTTSVFVEHALRDERADETRFLLSASMPLGPDRSLSASYNSQRETTRLEYRKRHRNYVGEYGYDLRMEHDEDSVGLYGRADYIGNRFEASASLDHVAQDVGALFQGEAPLVGSLRLSSGLAFADGRVGVGRRIGGGFFLVEPHPTLEGARLSVGRAADQQALVTTDGFGAIVAPASTGYGLSELALNLEDGPIGYDFGSGLYAAELGARGGAFVLVGDDAFYSMRGVLLNAEGEPVASRLGKLTPLGSGRPALNVFTNQAGVFFASGLEPGPYEMEIDGSVTRIELRIPAEGAFVELGDVILGGTHD
ncbi:hypothetical protein [Neomegalonema sp.]|uniref:hypothetical protein n=1 Tax=Neomegalonema sp. TaxID=2039713 RepID=UPI002614F100|nr:hypothetical protein [Neomegalonema sp.]MDD2867739.1 hypothetical protein [Neomegalonema sp.]